MTARSPCLAACALALALSASMPAAAQFTLPQGTGRVSIGTYFIHQPLPSFNIPRVVDPATLSTLLNELDSVLGGAGGITGNGLSLIPSRDLALFAPGLSFGGSADAVLSVAQVDYGITDSITASVIWPYFDYAKTTVNFSAPNSLLAYNLGFNPYKPVSLLNFPILWAPSSTSRGVTGTQGLQLILQNVFGYRPFTNWQSYGTGDPVVSVSHTLDRQTWYLRSTALVYIPLGKIADPNNPLAIPFGDGHVKVGARLWLEDVSPRPYSIIVSVNWLASFIDHPLIRAYEFSEVPLWTADSEHRVTRIQGQHLSGTLGVSRWLTQDFLRVQILASVEHIFPDYISGPAGTDYSAVVTNTTMNVYGGELSLTLSTVQKYLAKEFWIPAQITVALRDQITDAGTFSGLGQLQAQLTVSTFF